MKIVVHVPDDHVNIRLWFPLVFMKSRLVWKFVIKKSGDEEADDSIKELSKMSPRLYRAFRKYKSEHGKLKIVEVDSHDGAKVRIYI